MALAGMLAVGLGGGDSASAAVAQNGNAYEAKVERVPSTLTSGDLSRVPPGRGAFGDEMVAASPRSQGELEAFNATVTDWERYRGFERM